MHICYYSRLPLQNKINNFLLKLLDCVPHRRFFSINTERRMKNGSRCLRNFRGWPEAKIIVTSTTNAEEKTLKLQISSFKIAILFRMR